MAEAAETNAVQEAGWDSAAVEDYAAAESPVGFLMWKWVHML